MGSVYVIIQYVDNWDDSSERVFAVYKSKDAAEIRKQMLTLEEEDRRISYEIEEHEVEDEYRAV